MKDAVGGVDIGIYDLCCVVANRRRRSCGIKVEVMVSEGGDCVESGLHGMNSQQKRKV